MELTVEDIEQDISGFEQRVQAARDKLAELPVGFLPLQEHKKREKQRRDFEDEIAHVKRLIDIAMSALTGCNGERD